MRLRMIPTPVFVCGGDALLTKMFRDHAGYYPVEHPKSADILVYPGGPDVSPDMYADLHHPKTSSLPERDQAFSSLYYKHKDKLHVGICGGGQFLNVISGGRMWQDVDNHAIAGTHLAQYVADDGGEVSFHVTSTHHQMMKMAFDGKLFGYTKISTYRDTGGDRKMKTNPSEGPDVEIVWYKKTQCLCFQPHPEYGHDPTHNLFFRCLNRVVLPF